MKGIIIGIIVAIMLVAGGWYFFVYEPDPEPTTTQFGSWGTNLKLEYADGTHRNLMAPLAIYDDGKLLTSIYYELSAKAVGPDYNSIVVKFDDFKVDWKIKQGSTVKHTYTDYWGVNPDCPNIVPVSDKTFSVDGAWHLLISYNTRATCSASQTCACVLPLGFTDGSYTLSMEPSGSITYNPDGLGWETATLPDPVSFNIDVIGLQVYFKQGDY